jgi:hypothetical protein
MSNRSAPPPSLDEQVLRDHLLGTVDLLRQRRASDIAEGLIDSYVARNWLEWNGGGLRLTTTGDNVCKQLTTRLETPESELDDRSA